MPVVASFGDVNVDLIVSVDRHPPPGQESFAEDAAMGLGGSAANTAVALARLGFGSRILAQVGEDDLASQAITRLEAAGVDTRLVARSPDDSTGINIVLVDPEGERTMIGLRGANRSYRGSPGWEAGIDWLHMSGYAFLGDAQAIAAADALEMARAMGIPISFDVPSGAATTLGGALAKHLAGASILAVGTAPLAEICPGPDPLGQLRDLGVGTVAVTDGDRPFSIHRGGETETVEPPHVDVVDTTGAGDSFAAGLVAASLRNLSLGATAVLAAALGAAAAGVRGAGDHLADVGRLERLLSQTTWEADAAWRAEALASVPTVRHQ